METHEPIRILIVDDSRIFRGVMESILQQIPDVSVAGSVFSGEKALEFIEQTPVDLITLDVEMPGIGGLGTLRALAERKSDMHQRPVDIILVSALTESGSRITVEGLQLGALDFILKPCLSSEQHNRELLHNSLIEKLAAYRHRRRRSAPLNYVAPTPSSSSSLASRAFRAIAIGTSTGGPEALVKLLPALARQCQLPIFIIQHNLPGLSGFMAESLGKHAGRKVFEAYDNQRVESGGIYLARSGQHLVVRLHDGHYCLGITNGPAEKGCRPAVDVFLRSAAVAYGSSLLTVILTGMGEDGAEGVRAAKRLGSYILAQDEASSVVWGMPGAAIATGAVDEVLPLSKIAERLVALSASKK